jgi:hypothetical protein
MKILINNWGYYCLQLICFWFFGKKNYKCNRPTQGFFYPTSTHVDVILLFSYAWSKVKVDKCLISIFTVSHVFTHLEHVIACPIILTKNWKISLQLEYVDEILHINVYMYKEQFSTKVFSNFFKIMDFIFKLFLKN